MSPDNQWIKLGLAAVVAGLGALLIAANDDRISLSEWIAVALAVFTALAGTEAYVQRKRAKAARAEADAEAFRAAKEEQ